MCYYIKSLNLFIWLDRKNATGLKTLIHNTDVMSATSTQNEFRQYLYISLIASPRLRLDVRNVRPMIRHISI